MTFINSTLSGNEATLAGGGVYIHPTGESTFQRSLVSGNAAPNGREVYSAFTPYSSGVISADAFNLFGFSGDAGVFGFSPGPTDIVPAEPSAAILAALADNGGPTLTRALVPGSPAIDAAPGVACAAPPINSLDQRGLPRNVDGDGLPSANECDIGAFEFQPAN
jgi:hypothetical protein